MKKSLIIMVLCVFGLTLTISCNHSDTKAQIEKCIEEGDFTKAKQLNKKLEYGGMGLKICKAQVSSLIDEGQFNLAADVAKEDEDYGVYYEILMGKLVQLYDKNPQGLMAALASINFPTKDQQHWNGKYNPFLYMESFNAFFETYNNNIKQLMIYAKANDDLEYAKKISALLKPLYKSKMVKEEQTMSINTKTGERKKELVDVTKYEDTPTDFTQANQIKKELGIK